MLDSTRVVKRRCKRIRASVPQSAAAIAAILEAPLAEGRAVEPASGHGWPARPRDHRRRPAACSPRVCCRATPALTDRDTIILSDFVNTTSEPVFDGALKVALAVALEQSAFLKVFPDDSVRETLRLMQRSPDERVTRQSRATIAQREQLKALVAGSIGKLGQPLRRRARSGQRRDRRRHGARTG